MTHARNKHNIVVVIFKSYAKKQYTVILFGIAAVSKVGG